MWSDCSFLEGGKDNSVRKEGINGGKIWEEVGVDGTKLKPF